MKDPLEQIFHTAKQVTLSKNEKERLRARITTMMRDTQLQQEERNAHAWRIFFYKHTASVAIVTVLFFGGSTSALAEKALPGDVLYPIKTKVNEQVRGWFARNPDSQEAWQISLAERRLEEVKYIANDQTADPDVKALARKNFEDQVKRIEDESDDAERVAQVATTNARVATTNALAPRRTALFKAEREFHTEEATTSEGVENQIKQVEDKIHNLKKSIKEKKDFSKGKRNKLNSELILSEKALLESEDSKERGKSDEIRTHIEHAERRIRNVETRLESESEN